jgi:uncharacterized protein YjdB
VAVTGAPVAAVNVTPPTASVVVGQTTTLSAQPVDANGAALSGRAIAWSTSNDKVATVDQSGVVIGVAAGQATITATSEGKSGTAVVTVTAVPVASVTVAPPTLSLQTGQTGTLAATTKDAAGNVLTDRIVAWTSSNTGVATVAPNGTVPTVAPGTATITATSEGKTGTSTITVTAPPPTPVATVAVSPSSVNLTIGGTQQITATPQDAQGNALAGRAVTWQSGNTQVATVTAAGLITAVGAGSTTVTATSEGKTGTVSVTVAAPAVGSVSVSPGSATVSVAATTQLTATVRDVSGAAMEGVSVSWASDKPLTAAVSQSGVVTGLLPGTATITATAGERSGTATITVQLAPVASVTVSPSTLSLRDRDNQRTGTLTATVKDLLGNVLTGRVVTWASSNTQVATVDQSGLVTAQNKGDATISAASEGKIGTAAVNVRND